MGALTVTDRPTSVEPTEEKTRKRRTPEERARAAEERAAAIRAEAQADADKRARRKAERCCRRAHDALGEAAVYMDNVDKGKANELLSIASLIDGLELGAD